MKSCYLYAFSRRDPCTLVSCLYRLGIGVVLFFAFAQVAAAAVSLTLPNGGECLTVGQAYAITITYNTNHIALYYKTDGTQPAPADGGPVTEPSVIDHPENATTFNWTPASSHVSETGRIWIEGHLANHNTNGEWDQSDANFYVRTSCAAAASGGSSGAFFNAFPPIPQLPMALSPTSIRWNFTAPEYAVGEVRLLKKENFVFLEITRQAQSIKANAEGSIVEANLLPNTRYAERYLQVAKEDALTNVSNVSNPHYPAFTLMEISRALATVSVSSTTLVLRVNNPLSNLEAALSGVWFENITASTSSLWQKQDRWTFTKLEPDTLYQFRAKARNGEGIETPFSELLSVITPPASPESSFNSPLPAPETLQPTSSPTPLAEEGLVPSISEGLFRIAEDPRVWRVEGGYRRHIPSPEIFLSYSFAWNAVTVISSEELYQIPESALLRGRGMAEVWFIEEGLRRHIPNPDVFVRHGFAWDAVLEANATELSAYAPVSLLQVPGDARVWFVQNGIRRWIPTPAVFRRHGYRWQDVQRVPWFELEAYQEKEPIF